MWRSFFLAVGIFMCIVGVECLAIDRAILARGEGSTAAARDIIPPEWAPWSLMSAGSVVILYSFTLPKRVAGG